MSRMSPNVANVANVANERRNVANVANGAVCLQAIFALVSLREMSGDILCCMSPRTSPTSPTSPRAANVSNVSRRHTECLQETFNLALQCEYPNSLTNSNPTQSPAWLTSYARQRGRRREGSQRNDGREEERRSLGPGLVHWGRRRLAGVCGRATLERCAVKEGKPPNSLQPSILSPSLPNLLASTPAHALASAPAHSLASAPPPSI